jgi:hypothetical protein
MGILSGHADKPDSSFLPYPGLTPMGSSSRPCWQKQTSLHNVGLEEWLKW